MRVNRILLLNCRFWLITCLKLTQNKCLAMKPRSRCWWDQVRGSWIVFRCSAFPWLMHVIKSCHINLKNIIYNNRGLGLCLVSYRGESESSSRVLDWFKRNLVANGLMETPVLLFIYALSIYIYGKTYNIMNVKWTV